MDWFSFLYNNFCIAAQGILQLGFICRFTEKKYKIWHFGVYLFLLYILDSAGRAFSLDDVVILVQILILYEMARLPRGTSSAGSNPAYKGAKISRSASCSSAILAVYIVQLSFGIMNSVELFVLPDFLEKPVLYLILILATGISFTLCIGCYHLILKYFSLKDSRQEPYLWMLLSPELFFFAAELYILHTAYASVPVIITASEKQMHLALLFLQTLGLAALFSALYAYKCTCRGFQTQAALASLAQETHAQKTYVAEAQMRYEQTRAFRHDIKNHFSILKGLLKNRKIPEAEHYLQELTEISDHLSFPCQTGHPVIDILLMEKTAIAQSNEIETEVSLTLPEKCTVDNLDWCVIFGNALDNAIQGCIESRENCKFIHIFGERQGDFYMLEFENTSLPGALPEKGIGLSNIETVAQKYHGLMNMEKSGSLFRLNVLLSI